MRFQDPPGNDQEGLTRIEFHKLDADIQLALEELDHTLATLGIQLVIKSCAKGVLEMEIWITN